MIKRIIFLSLGLPIFAVFLAACDSGAMVTETVNNNKAVVTNSAATDKITNDSAKAFSVDFKAEPTEIKAGTQTTLVFTVKDKQGGVVKDLQIVHEKPMHLLVVSKDLAEFYHVHPEQNADGSYRLSHVFPNGGDYKLYADFTPKDAVQVVEQIDVKVAGTERAKVALQPDASFEKSVESLKVLMKPSAEIKAGQELTLDFQAFDASSGKPATDLQNYLGEIAHFVIISEDMKDFVHAHPMAKGEKMGDMKTDEKKPMITPLTDTIIQRWKAKLKRRVHRKFRRTRRFREPDFINCGRSFSAAEKSSAFRSSSMFRRAITNWREPRMFPPMR
ncbi:MAG: hypothetical protein WKF71_04510 [Pyrinomonadaceae bacterium]